MDKWTDNRQPPAGFPLHHENELETTILPNCGGNCGLTFNDGHRTRSDPMSFPRVSLPVTSSGNTCSLFRTCTKAIQENYGNPVANFVMLDSLQSLKMHQKPKSFVSSASRVDNVSGISMPERSIIRSLPCINQDYNVAASNAMHKNPANISAPVTRRASQGCEMVQQSGEAQNSHFIRQQMMGNLVCAQTSGRRQIGDDVNGSADRFGFQETIDGSFLSLGIGRRTEAISKHKFSSQEVARKLEEAVSPELCKSQVEQNTESLSSSCHNMKSGFPDFQITDFGLSNSLCNCGGWNSLNNGVGIIRGSNMGPIYLPEDILLPHISGVGGQNLSFLDKSNVSYDQCPFDAIRGNQDALSGVLDYNLPGFSDCKQIGLSKLAAEHVGPPWRTAPTSDQLHDTFVKEVRNLSSEYYMKSPRLEFGRFSATGNHEDHIFLPNGIASRPSGGTLLPEKIEIQAIETSAAQAASSGLFPKRLGLEVIGNGASQSCEIGKFAKSTARVCQPPVAFSQSIRSHRFADGQPLKRSSDQLPRASVQPSLKRSTAELHPAVCAAKHQKIARTTAAPLPYPVQTVSPIPPTASGSLHIKWEGFDGPIPTSGQRCLLCKRDLSFTPEGRVYQPSVPPSVAVLPCRHTFHDQCLQNITPNDQSKNPPCIPCAIGEKLEEVAEEFKGEYD